MVVSPPVLRANGAGYVCADGIVGGRAGEGDEPIRFVQHRTPDAAMEAIDAEALAANQQLVPVSGGEGHR